MPFQEILSKRTYLVGLRVDTSRWRYASIHWVKGAPILLLNKEPSTPPGQFAAGWLRTPPDGSWHYDGIKMGNLPYFATPKPAALRFADKATVAVAPWSAASCAPRGQLGWFSGGLPSVASRRAPRHGSQTSDGS